MKLISIKICMVIAALCCMVPATAQKTFGSAKYTAMCSYYGETITGDLTAYEAGSTAQTVVKDIMSVIGLKANFELRAANVPNAAAVILKSKRYILYNPEFMDNINSASGSRWAAISILAHEIGHHLNGHTLDNVGSRPQTELEADEFSGFVLRKMGATLEDAQSAMALIASMKGSHTHPAKKDRLAYIASGWNTAGGTATNSSQIADNTPRPSVSKPAVAQRPVVQRQAAQRPVRTTQVAARRQQPQTVKPAQSVLASNYIASDAYFNNDPKGQYFLTVRGNLVQVANNNIYPIASLAQSDRTGYKLMFSDEDLAGNIYIGSGGALLNGSGHKIGYLKAR